MISPDRLLELAGMLSGLACIWLMIRQNVLTFPLGLVFALITVVVMWRNNLYADVLLNSYYVIINAYGWWYWMVRKEEAGVDLPVSRTPTKIRWLLLPIGIVGFALLVFVLSNYTGAQLVYANSLTTILSFIAMWMSARKFLESWSVWVVVNVVSVPMYAYQGILPYAVLYLVYLGMAIQGYRAWAKSMQST